MLKSRFLMLALIIVIAIIIMGLIVGVFFLRPPAKKKLTIATAGTAGALYPMGVAMAEVINKYLPEYMASAISSAGSIENIRFLREGKVEWGISTAEIAYMAYHGLELYKDEAFPELRALFGNLISYIQIFVRKDSGIVSIADFKGKRLGTTPPGSTGEWAARKILEYYGLSYSDLASVFQAGVSELVEALKDGKIDGFIATHPLRSSALIELTIAMKGNIEMLSIEDPSFYERYPYYTKTKVPAGTYEGIDHDVYIPTCRVVMLTTKSMSEDDIYKLLKVIWEHRDEWKDVHVEVANLVTLDKALEGVPIPLHAGALKFYREKGFTIPGELIPPEAKK